MGTVFMSIFVLETLEFSRLHSAQYQPLFQPLHCLKQLLACCRRLAHLGLACSQRLAHQGDLALSEVVVTTRTVFSELLSLEAYCLPQVVHIFPRPHSNGRYMLQVTLAIHQYPSFTFNLMPTPTHGSSAHCKNLQAGQVLTLSKCKYSSTTIAAVTNFRKA